MRGFLSFLIDMALPISCVACGRDLPAWEEEPCAAGTGLFGGSFDSVGRLYEPIPGIRIEARTLCAECRRSLEWAPPGAAIEVAGAGVPLVAPFHTNDALLALVRFLKFSGGRSAAPPLASWMARALCDHLERAAVCATGGMLLVPVPLHPRRLRERGYNQAELLAKMMVPVFAASVDPHVIIRQKDTASQSRLDDDAREENVRRAFRLERPELVEGRHVVLVDDLVTTAATARACLEALLAGTPASMAVLAAGRARAASAEPLGTPA